MELLFQQQVPFLADQPLMNPKFEQVFEELDRRVTLAKQQGDFYVKNVTNKEPIPLFQ